MAVQFDYRHQAEHDANCVEMMESDKAQTGFDKIEAIQNLQSSLFALSSGISFYDSHFGEMVTNIGTPEENGGRTGPDEYMDENGTIHTNPNGKGNKYVVNSNDIAWNTDGSINYDLTQFQAILLPDAENWEAIKNDIQEPISINNEQEDAGIYIQHMNGEIQYEYAGKSVRIGNTQDVGPVLTVLRTRMLTNNTSTSNPIFRIIYVHSHPAHINWHNGETPSQPDINSVRNGSYNAGICITNNSYSGRNQGSHFYIYNGYRMF